VAQEWTVNDMAEYIESICNRCFHSYVCEQFNEHRDSNNEKCHFFNEHFVSAADVAPVVHGRWIDAREFCGDFMCSNCAALYGTNKFNYCPNCGASMKDGE
jgi:hypothetical protein